MGLFKIERVNKTRPLLSVLLILISVNIMAADELTSELVHSRILGIQEDGSSFEIDSTMHIYEDSLKWLREAETQEQNSASYANSIEPSLQRQADIQARLKTIGVDAVALKLESLEKSSLQQLRQQTGELRTQLFETHKVRDSTDRRIGRQEADTQGIEERLAEINLRENELPKSSISIDRLAKPTQLEASEWLVLAELKALYAERQALSARLHSQPARFGRRQLERKEATLTIRKLQSDLALVEDVIADKEGLDSSETVKQPSPDEPGFGTVQSMMAANEELQDQRLALLEKLSSATSYHADLQQKKGKLDEEYEAASQIVESAGGSSSIGRILMEYWRKASQFRPVSFTLIVDREIGDFVIRRAEHETQLTELAGVSSDIGQLFSGVSNSSEISNSTIETATGQIRIKRSHLSELIGLESQLLGVLREVEKTHDQLNSKVDEYTTFLTSHILWVESHTPVDGGVWKQLLKDVRRTTSELASTPHLTLNAIAALGLILSLVLFWLRKRLVSGRKTINQKIGRPRSDSAKYTFLALLLTALQTAPLPLLFLVLATALQDSTMPAALDLSDTLPVATEALFLTLFLRAACDEHGVARVHFHWAAIVCDRISALAKWSLLRLWPLMLVTSVLVHMEADSINAVLGRFFYCATILTLGYKIIQVLRTNLDGDNINGPGRTVAIGLVFFSLLGLTVMVLTGYMLPARVIMLSLFDSLNVVIMLIFTYFILMRWLMVTRRQLRFRQLVEVPEDNDQADSETELDYAPHLSELSETAGELLKAATVTLGAVWLLYVWFPLLPAFQGFRRITLWTVTKTSGGVEVIDNITLATLLLAILIAAGTLYAARKLPSLLELFLRSYSPLTPGTRYAAVTVLNYIIIGTGVIFLLSTLGLRWEKLQWLVAALSVGIGFGLQEIVANFISGLIILFERPIRVGDFVTVGECSGRVSRIQIRATTILDLDRKELLVPNKEFVTGRLLNWTLSDAVIRLVIKVGIAYGSDVQKAMRTLFEVVKGHDEVLEAPEPSILFSEFGDSALTLTAFYFISSPGVRQRIASELHQQIELAFRKEDIEFAFPQLDLHLNKQSPLRISIEKPDQ